MYADKTALVTGANSGLGFEAAAQLALKGFGRVILVTRSQAKGQTAKRELVERVGLDPFEVVSADMGKHQTVRDAVVALQERGGVIDYLLLNAGLVAGSDVRMSDDGVEITVAASLTGHHVLTVQLLKAGLLGASARIVIAGSEAARGDVPMFTLTDVPDFARAHTDGDLAEAVALMARAQAPHVYSKMPQYGMTKVFVAWWAAALARRLPEGMSVLAISPGSTPDTAAMRNQPWLMQVVMGAVMATVGTLMGMGHSLETAVGRYLSALERDALDTGHFYASAPGKMTGPLFKQEQPHIQHQASQEAAWVAMVALTDAALPTLKAVDTASA